MEIEIATLAEYAVVAQDNKMSIMGIFDVVGAPRFPVIHPKFFVCVRIGCRPIEQGTNHVLNLIIQDPDGRPLGPRLNAAFTVNPSPYPAAPKISVQMVFGFAGVQFPKPGVYSVELAIDELHRASIPISLVAASVPPSS